jgi:anaerobic selenocysteine-containing dehydrogenase
MSQKNPGTWVKTHCARFDHGGCGLDVFVSDGKPLQIKPDKSDPFSKGYFCRKGLSSIERVFHPGRLKKPLLRKGKRGEGAWVQISWDKALDILSSEFANAIEKAGPESVAFAQGAPKGLEFFLLLRLANLLKVPTVGAAQHVCHMPREQMGLVTCGFFPVPDYESPTGCVLLWGSDPERTNEEGVLGNLFTGALERGAKLIVVDPLRTDPAHRACLWLQIHPGRDDLLAAGFLRVIIEEGLYDREFVERWTIGFSQLRESVREFDPARVSAGTGVPERQIIDAARLYATSKPALIHWGNAIEHTANSSQTCRMLVILMALTGNLEAPGGNIKAQSPELMRPSELICLKEFPGRAEKLPNRRFGLIPRLLTTPNWILFRLILERSPYPIRCLYLQGTNPVITCSDPQQVREALLKLDFLAVADIFMTPSAALADLVLPVATNFEFNDIGHYGLPHGHIFARPGLIEPQGEAWPDIKILNNWGKRMGLGNYFWDTENHILEDVVKPSGLTYGQFAQKGILSGPKTMYSYKEKGFATPSGKVELSSGLLGKWGYSSTPVVAGHMETDEQFPFLLTSRKPRSFFHSAYRNIERLRKRAPNPKALIHPDAALRIGISQGAALKISTSYGSIVQIAEFSEDIGLSVIMADYGWWFPERPDESFCWADSNINCLTSSNGPIDPILGTVQLRGIPCKVEKIE